MKPYVYIIEHKNSGALYVGMRTYNITLNLAPHEDLLKVYFTSSSVVQKMIDDEGEGSFHILEIKDYDTKEEASQAEYDLILLKRSTNKLLNRAAHGKFFMSVSGSDTNIAAGLKRRGLVWYNNGKEEGKFREGQQPEGWSRFRAPFDTGRVICNDGKRQRQYHPSKIPEGWVAGILQSSRDRNSAGNKGKRWYTDGVIDRKLYPDEVGAEWRLGRTFFHDEETRARISKTGSNSSPYKGWRWCNNGIEKKRVPPSAFLEHGWRWGNLMTPETIEKVRRALTGRSFTEEHKRNISISKKSRAPAKLVQLQESPQPV